MDKTERQFLTPPDIADQLGCNADRVRNWINSGQLPASNIGDRSRPRWRIRKTDFDDFLMRRSNQSEVPPTPPRRRRRPTASSVKEFF
jgi:excisionase family DNA binding protein